MENDLSYREFCSQFDAYFRRNEESFGSGKGEVRYRFFPKGFTAVGEADMKFVRDTNMKYYQLESDRLQGDFAVLKSGKEDSIRTTYCFSAEKMYGQYQRYGWDRVRAAVEENLRYCRQEDIGIVSHMSDYQAVKERLIIRPLCYKNMIREASACVYRRVEDIALVLYLVIKEDESGLGTIKVPRAVYEKWGESFDEVMDAALVNTHCSALPRLYLSPLDCIRPPYQKGAFMAAESTVGPLERWEIPTVTTTKQVNGAVAMFYPGVKERIAELYGDSYYVVFTSIHEARTHCRGAFSPRHMLRSLKETNQAFPTEEMLSEKVFYYDRDKRSFEALML